MTQRLFRLLSLCVLATTLLATALGAPRQASARSDDLPPILLEEFDARSLNEAEKRLLQIALGHSGDYLGQFDGQWGKMSQEAIERFASRQLDRTVVPNVVAALLAQDALDRRAEFGMRDRRVARFAAAIRLPDRMLREIDRNAVRRAWETPSGDLSVSLELNGSTSPAALHEGVIKHNRDDRSPYTVRKADRLITSARNRAGGVYLRSERGRMGWVTLEIVSKTDTQLRMQQVIASSFYVGRRRPWIDDETPVLDRLREQTVGALDAPRPSSKRGKNVSSGDNSGRTSPHPSVRRPPERRSSPTPERRSERPRRRRGDITGSGSGFFISAADVVTNNHVIKGCARLESDAGAVFEVVAKDAGLDLAILRSDTPAKRWLSISRDDPLLGANVFVLGYPLYEAFSKSLTATRGVMSAERGLLGDSNSFTLSAEVQPGNSGGPVLNRDGEVVGVVVARISDKAVTDATGAIPQNVNYAIRRTKLIPFLERHLGAAPLAAGRSEIDLDDGVPRELQEPVVPILCLRR